MYAWQAMTDIRKYSELLKLSPHSDKCTSFLESTKDVCEAIILASKYNLGDYSDLYNSMEDMFGRWEKRNKHKIRLFLDLGEFLKLPNGIIWFECDTNKNHIGSREDIAFRIGVLATQPYEQFDDIIIANLFSYVNSEWIMMPFQFFISLGKHLKDTKFMSHVEDYDYSSAIQPIPLVDKSALGVSDINKEDLVAEAAGHLEFLYVSLLLLNCRNVGTVTHAPKKKKIKTRMSPSERAKFEYKTLVLRENPGETKYEDDNKNKRSRGIRPLSMIDRYFRIYEKDRPMFGNPDLYGLMWVKAHTRGNPEQGVIINEREVKVKTERR